MAASNEEKQVAEAYRRMMAERINEIPLTREQLETKYGKVWNTIELTEEFTVQGFQAPFCVVTRKSDNTLGSVMFQHNPRFYFGWECYVKET